MASFVGVVRNRNDGNDVTHLTLEHYPAMTERALAGIVERARARWDVCGVTVIHRVGEMAGGEHIVLVVVTSAHRREAFEACEFIMDWLKTEAPFWKKERTPEGERWVDARESDEGPGVAGVRPHDDQGRAALARDPRRSVQGAGLGAVCR